MAKDKYEISLWEDYEVPANNDVPAHYEEKKIAIIGSDTMTAPCRALEPKLVENVNGTNTFTFKMLYLFNISDIEEARARNTIADDLTWITDDEQHDKYRNPFINLLVNERKVKALWKGKWYDLVIKNIQEDSNGRSAVYTCKDLFINELSKTGFELTFDNELENNQGTAPELATKVLDNTDWKFVGLNGKVLRVDENGDVVATQEDGPSNIQSDTIKQEKEEPVYELITQYEMTEVTNQNTGGSASIPAQAKILIYYQQIQDLLNSGESSGESTIQFAYAQEYARDTNSQLVINADCYLSGNLSWALVTIDDVSCIRLGSSTNPWGYIYHSEGPSSNYRASRLVQSSVCKLDPLTGQYCYVYKASATKKGSYNINDEIYMYHSTKYKDATFVNNLIVNGSGFTSTDGWYTPNENNTPTFRPYPDYDGTIDWSPKMYLYLKSGVTYTNYGIRQTSNFIPNGFKVGEKYIFRFRARTVNGSNPGGYSDSLSITPQIVGVVSGQDVKYFSVGAKSTANYNNGKWIEYTLTCTKSATRAQIYNNNIVLKLTPGSNLYLEETELFPYVKGTDNKRINPGDYDTESVAQVYYSYYNHTTSQSLTNADNIEYLYEDTQEWSNTSLAPQYNENFEKIRSISAKQSNRFNLLQSIAETFECWVRFIIIHDPNTGRIECNNDGTPQKYVVLKKEVGQETGIGFIYGIDLKTISRTIKSDQIVTKTIVPQNSNEFAQNGFCTIARSEENYPRVNFILNFDYYINQGLLANGKLNKDLYVSPTRDSSEVNGQWVLEDEDIYDQRYKDKVDGYYFFLHKWNIEYDSNIEWIANKRTELDKQQSLLTVYQDTLIALQQQKTSLQSQLINIAGAKTWKGAQDYLTKNENNDEIKSRQAALSSVQTQIDLYNGNKTQKTTGYITNIANSISNLEKALKQKEDRQEILLNYIKDKHFAFYKKYSRFLQEGTWTSEDYIDDDLFYLDAQSVAYTSSRPQIEYNISVLRLSSIEEFKNKVFHLGDIAYIQDTEFFGYIGTGFDKTPYKEKVLVSEVTSNFDEPEKDSFKIQNYKTQFEDLFQRITSTTQSLQYASGEYARAAGIIETDGTIKPETLQSSIAINQQLVFSAQNETVYNDNTGLTVASTTNPNNKTKITSGGVFITTDGGETWKGAIRGGGVATESLSAGAISANLINILDGEHVAFRWNSQGINAFFQEDFEGFTSINASKFVRFDHYGIYGINGAEQFDPDVRSGETGPIGEEKIWNTANFGMTWHGFFLRNVDDSGSIQISSDKDIQILAKNSGNEITERVKIGRLYGIGETGYIAKTESTPIEGVTYYIQNGPWYDEADLTQFKNSLVYAIIDYELAELFQKQNLLTSGLIEEFIENKDYYKLDSSNELIIATESSPDPEVVYYWLTDFNNDKNYYTKINNNYIQVDTQNTVPVYGIDYYSFDPPVNTYYIKDEDGVFQIEEPTEENALLTNFYILNVSYPDTSKKPINFIQYYIENNGTYIPTTSADFTTGFLTGQDAPTYYKKISSTAYGIRISDASGAAVMETSSNGTLWLRKALYIQSTNNPNDEQGLYNIALGFLGEEYPGISQNISATNYQLWPSGQQKDINVQYYSYDSETHQYTPNDNGNYYLQITQEMREKGLYKRNANDEQAEPQPTTNSDTMGLKGFTYFYLANLHQIFNANNNFILYEDGSITANNGTFNGEINATGGTFTGELLAATGQFSGEIVADSGWFGKPNKGIEITENGLVAINGSSITIDGGNFEIYDSKYDLYVPRPDEFDVNTEYWYQDEEGDWTLEDSSEPVEGRDYYSRTRNNKVFYFNQEKNILSVIGRIEATEGYFSGELRAANGTFTGELVAPSGTIGGFEILNGYLRSTERPKVDTIPYKQVEIGEVFEPGITYYEDHSTLEDYIFTPTADVSPDPTKTYYIFEDNYYYLNDEDEYISIVPNTNLPKGTIFYADTHNIELNGGNGSIIANTITLGTGATIASYIELGDHVKLLDADVNNGRYLTVTDENNIEKIIFKNDAIIQLGDIYLNGNNSTISGGDFTSQYHFSITPEQASFSNIVASGKISTVVFEQNHVQAVGGSMVFKPSFKIERVENEIINNQNFYRLFLDNDIAQYISYGETEYYIDIIDTSGRRKTLNPILAKNPNDEEYSDELLILQSEISNISDASFVIILGSLGDLIIGINTNNTESSYLRARGITVADFTKENNKFDYSIKAFLGDLDATGLFTSSEHGFGLYTQNAYLTGSLTTQLDSGKYAGVNTLNGVGADIFGTNDDDDQSSIVFWAGSNSESDEDIKDSPFQVTENGSLYASQGRFEGAIITKSEIRGADLYAARIHGTGLIQENENNEYGLAFYNMANGIVFKTGGDYDGEITYRPYDPQPESSFDATKEYWYNDNGIWVLVDLTIIPVPVPQVGVQYYKRIITSDVFWIGEKGLALEQNKYFISIENQNVIFSGQKFSTSNGLYMQDKIIGLQTSVEDKTITVDRLVFRDNNSTYGFFFQTLADANLGTFRNFLEINSETNEIKSYAQSTYIDQNLNLQDKLEYRPVSSGYDLYVR